MDAVNHVYLRHDLQLCDQVNASSVMMVHFREQS